MDRILASVGILLSVLGGATVMRARAAPQRLSEHDVREHLYGRRGS